MDFEWDEDKRLKNIEKHGIDFYDADIVFEGPLLVGSARTVEGETREQAVGMLDDIHVATVYTWRGSIVRIISMRRARHEERRKYQESF